MSIGLKANNDGSGAIQVGGTDRVTLSSAGVMSVPAGITAALTGNVTGAVTGNAATATALSTASGSAPSYSARAWVNFNGTGTVAIRASGNVSSITDNGTGDYTVNFATAMVDTNYCPVVGGDFSQGATRDNGMYIPTNFTFSTGTLRISVTNYVGAYTDIDTVLLAIFR